MNLRHFQFYKKQRSFSYINHSKAYTYSTSHLKASFQQTYSKAKLDSSEKKTRQIKNEKTFKCGSFFPAVFPNRLITSFRAEFSGRRAKNTPRLLFFPNTQTYGENTRREKREYASVHMDRNVYFFAGIDAQTKARFSRGRSLCLFGVVCVCFFHFPPL